MNDDRNIQLQLLILKITMTVAIIIITKWKTYNDVMATF